MMYVLSNFLIRFTEYPTFSPRPAGHIAVKAGTWSRKMAEMSPKPALVSQMSGTFIDQHGPRDRLRENSALKVDASFSLHSFSRRYRFRHPIPARWHVHEAVLLSIQLVDMCRGDRYGVPDN